VPRLKCTFRDFIEILLANDFVLFRQDGSHRRYTKKTKDATFHVTVAAHNVNDEIRPGTLKAMIRQSGLHSSLFRK
jgi:predicted RNA binding protein YcfA (HicA-like mRNA interferase family)